MDDIKPGKIYSAIPAIISEVGAVGKTEMNRAQGYKYRSADAICDALHDALGRHKVFTTCDIVSREVHERASSKSGSVLIYVNLKCRYLFHCEDGSSVYTESWGEAMDSGDKASNKAMSAAYKYAAFQAFCIPTEGDNDADSQTHEVAAATTDPAVEAAVQLAATIEELNGIWKSLNASERKVHLSLFSEKKSKLALA